MRFLVAPSAFRRKVGQQLNNNSGEEKGRLTQPIIWHTTLLPSGALFFYPENKKMKLPIFLEDAGRPVAYYPKLAKFLGSVNSAIFLCQFIYWKGKEKTENEFFKTAEEIEEETGLTYKQQKNARKILKEKGYLTEKLKGVPAKVHYSFNWEKISNDWQEFLRQEDQENKEGSNKIDPKGQTGSDQRDELDNTKGTNYIHRLQHRIHREYNNNSSTVSNSFSHKGEEHSLTNKQPIAKENTEKENSLPIRQSSFKRMGNITIFRCPVCGRDYPESMAIQISPRDWICKDCHLQKRKKIVEFNKKKTNKKVPLNVDYERVMAYKEKTGGKIISDKERTAMEVKIAKTERRLKSGKISELDLKY